MTFQLITFFITLSIKAFYMLLDNVPTVALKSPETCNMLNINYLMNSK